MDLRLGLNIVTTTFIVVGGILGLLQLRQTHKQRARESALQMLYSFQTPEFLTAANLMFELPDGLGRKDIEARLGGGLTGVLVMMGTFESLGILVYRRDVDIRLVEDFFSGVLVLSRRKLAGYLADMRRSGSRDTYYEWYQWLAEQVERREQATPPVPAYVEHRDWEA